MPIILATEETEIRKTMVRSQPGQIVHETISRKKKSQKRAGGVARSVGLNSSPRYLKKRKKERKKLIFC
jgi:hypothetical protein